ncbi:helix-turn-helix domain-containing protein [Nonomuraea angiospora]
MPAALAAAGELCVRDLAAVVGRNTSAVSHSLRMLRGHRIVRARRAGRLAYYRPRRPVGEQHDHACPVRPADAPRDINQQIGRS